MQVILVKSVRKLGKVGETVNVKDGYGRNFLIPQEFAIRATKENISKFAALQKDLVAKNAKNKADAEKLAASLEGKTLTFITQSASDGRLFGSVSAKTLAGKITELAGHELNYSNILIASPIKFNGVYKVQVALHPEVITAVLVVVAKTDSEAVESLREFKEGGKKAAAEEAEAEADNIDLSVQATD